jgi:site-specific DNA-methyltransferase (cytosine-N4-specific)
MQQLAFFPDVIKKRTDLKRDTFSHGGVCSEDARIMLEDRYKHLVEETGEFNRQLVSFQTNKTKVLHSWIKYREGFSDSLVEILIKKFGVGPGDTILEPFAGSCTTLLVAQMLGINSVGIELLPHCHLAWAAKSQVFDYNLDELRYINKLAQETTLPTTHDRFPHLTITQTAFPDQAERDLMAYKHWIETLDVSEEAQVLCRLALISILEKISYTRKDGQFLRWDRRAQKMVERNAKRMAQGKKPFRGIYKGELPSVKEAFTEALSKIIVDVSRLQSDPPPKSCQQLIDGNTLYVLPEMEADQFDAVITSPPYANRYDYTRTYALELAYLGVDEEIFNLRQSQLSCTVENQSKLDKLAEFYRSIGQHDRYLRIVDVVQNNKALAEVNAALQTRNELGEINNTGVLTMIAQYFTELTFVFAELQRVCQSGARVAFVNDNVRYAGEIIPVDTLTTNLAEQVGFEPVKIHVLPQRKGNSSQQMGRYGRAALRKSITVWQKPSG